MVGKTAAAAVLSVPEQVQQNEVRKQRVLRRRGRKRVEPLIAYGLFVTVAVGLVLLYVAQYAYVAQLNLRLSRAENRLAEMETLNEQLEQEAAGLKSLQRVELEAVKRLGMQKPQAVRTVKASLSSPPETVAVAETKDPLLAVTHQPSRLRTFLNWTRGLRKAWAHGVEENR